MKKSKGFTLIEIMVVIAVIAILATVVLISLQGARDAAEDAARMTALSQIRSFPTQERIEELQEEYGHILEVNRMEEERKYCAKIELRSGGYFCIDSEGFADKTSSPDCVGGAVCVQQ